MVLPIFIVLLLLLTTYTLGLTEKNHERNLIVGGTVTPEERYKYTVALHDGISSYCGGSLISKSVVLTAAHCVAFDMNFTVIIGRHNITNAVIGDDVTVAEKVLYPTYDLKKSDENDIALVFLARPTTADVDIVHLNTNDDIPIAGSDVTYLGWGEMDSNSSTTNTSDVLREVQTTVITNEQCESAEGIVVDLNITTSYKGLITDAMLCTFAIGKDSCQKDSGGPLILRGNDASEDIQVGIASWGVGCASNTFPGVTTRISHLYEWIKEVVCDKSTNAGPFFECGYEQTSHAAASTDDIHTLSIPQMPLAHETPYTDEGETVIPKAPIEIDIPVYEDDIDVDTAPIVIGNNFEGDTIRNGCHTATAILGVMLLFALILICDIINIF